MEKRIIEYIIIDHSYPSETTEEVNKYLDMGWELYGELKVIGYFADWGEEKQHASSYSQAMVKRESDEGE